MINSSTAAAGADDIPDIFPGLGMEYQPAWSQVQKTQLKPTRRKFRRASRSPSSAEKSDATTKMTRKHHRHKHQQKRSISPNTETSPDISESMHQSTTCVPNSESSSSSGEMELDSFLKTNQVPLSTYDVTKTPQHPSIPDGSQAVMEETDTFLKIIKAIAAVAPNALALPLEAIASEHSRTPAAPYQRPEHPSYIPNTPRTIQRFVHNHKPTIQKMLTSDEASINPGTEAEAIPCNICGFPSLPI